MFYSVEFRTIFLLEKLFTKVDPDSRRPEPVKQRKLHGYSILRCIIDSNMQYLFQKNMKVENEDVTKIDLAGLPFSLNIDDHYNVYAPCESQEHTDNSDNSEEHTYIHSILMMILLTCAQSVVILKSLFNRISRIRYFARIVKKKTSVCMVDISTNHHIS